MDLVIINKTAVDITEQQLTQQKDDLIRIFSKFGKPVACQLRVDLHKKEVQLVVTLENEAGERKEVFRLLTESALHLD